MNRQKKVMILLFLAFAAVPGARAQEVTNDTVIANHSTVSTGPSVVFDLSGEGDTSSAWGADFMYRFNPKWEAGLQLNLNFHKAFERLDGFSLVLGNGYTF